jgi:hypothetical protein
MKITAKEIKQIKNDYENELIRICTNKTISKVLNEYTLPEQIRLSALLIFMKYI